MDDSQASLISLEQLLVYRELVFSVPSLRVLFFWTFRLFFREFPRELLTPLIIRSHVNLSSQLSVAMIFARMSFPVFESGSSGSLAIKLLPSSLSPSATRSCAKAIRFGLCNSMSLGIFSYGGYEELLTAYIEHQCSVVRKSLL